MGVRLAVEGAGLAFQRALQAALRGDLASRAAGCPLARVQAGRAGRYSQDRPNPSTERSYRLSGVL
jgi:hypothetical protein